MKLFKHNSAEYQISRFISQDSTHSSLESFQGILPSVDFLRCDDHHWFVVMQGKGQHSIQISHWLTRYYILWIVYGRFVRFDNIILLPTERRPCEGIELRSQNFGHAQSTS